MIISFAVQHNKTFEPVPLVIAAELHEEARHCKILLEFEQGGITAALGTTNSTLARPSR